MNPCFTRCKFSSKLCEYDVKVISKNKPFFGFSSSDHAFPGLWLTMLVFMHNQFKSMCVIKNGWRHQLPLTARGWRISRRTRLEIVLRQVKSLLIRLQICMLDLKSQRRFSICVYGLMVILQFPIFVSLLAFCNNFCFLLLCGPHVSRITHYVHSVGLFRVNR